VLPEIPVGEIEFTGKVTRISSSSVRLTDLSFFEDNFWIKTKSSAYISKKNFKEIFEGQYVSGKGESEKLGSSYYITVKSSRDIYNFEYFPGIVAGLFGAGKNISADFQVFLLKNLGEKSGELISSVFLGTGAGKSLKEEMNLSGLGHIFVVSGLHFYIIFTIIWVIMGFFHLNRNAKILITLSFLFCFLLITGTSPSSLRAFIMISFFMLFRLLQYPADSLNLLGLAAVSIMFSQPSYALDAGFHLSFAAAGGILLFSRYSGIFKRKIFKDLIPVLGAVFFSAPITLIHFGRLPFLSIIFNLLFASFISWYLLLGTLLSFFFYSINLWSLASVFLLGIKPGAFLTEKTISFLAQYYGTAEAPVWSVIILLAIIILIIFFLEKKLKKESIK